MAGISKYISVFSILLFGLASCGKIEQISPVPSIEFTSFSVFDTIDQLGNFSKGGELEFYFEDGDGNVGLESPSVGEVDTTNMFISLFRKEGDQFELVVDNNDNLMPSDYRIPYMERTGRNKIIQGTITLRFIYMYYSVSDSSIIKYEFRIKDRDGQYSNYVTTCEIPLSINGKYELPAVE